MITVLALMVLGILIGSVFNNRRKFISIIDKMTNWAIYTLLFLLGISVGLNKTIINHLDNIGLNSLLITIGSVLGSIIFALITYKIFFKNNNNKSLKFGKVVKNIKK